jgi:hypothetical protein
MEPEGEEVDAGTYEEEGTEVHDLHNIKLLLS